MTASETIRYLAPSQSAGKLFVQRGIESRVVMLNLLRFRDVADYSANPELAPSAPISGGEAFDRYIRHTLPFLRESGGDIKFLGAGGPFLIGPEDERWDMTMLVCQSSVASGHGRASYASRLTWASNPSKIGPLTAVGKPVGSLPDTVSITRGALAISVCMTGSKSSPRPLSLATAFQCRR